MLTIQQHIVITATPILPSRMLLKHPLASQLHHHYLIIFSQPDHGSLTAEELENQALAASNVIEERGKYKALHCHQLHQDVQ